MDIFLNTDWKLCGHWRKLNPRSDQHHYIFQIRKQNLFVASLFTSVNKQYYGLFASVNIFKTEERSVTRLYDSCQMVFPMNKTKAYICPIHTADIFLQNLYIQWFSAWYPYIHITLTRDWVTNHLHHTLYTCILDCN